MKFSSPCGNVTPGLERNRDGENSSFVTHVTFPLPHSWLSRCDEIKIPHERRGSGNVPFVTHEEFCFPIFMAAPLIWENPIPIFLQTGSRSYPLIFTNFARKEFLDSKGNDFDFA